ncbi:MAG TPA: phosphate ABC transporter permease PstA [Geobacterales bacterium]|nr:phosphate ABC transporter permease PstA [Geobacterales bacterium]
MIKKIKLYNILFVAICSLALIITLVPLIWILAEVIANGISAISFSLLTNLPAPPGIPGGGIGNYIQGTIILSAVASLIGFPVGLLMGIFISEYREHKFAPVVRFFVDVFAEFPAIVIGIFVYVIIVRGDIFKLFGINALCLGSICIGPTGFSAIAGSISLALLMIPIVTKSVEEALNLVPTSIKEAALAMGMPRWRMVLTISLSYARGGLILSYILALSRIAGEAAPLLLTVLGSFYWFTSFYDRIGALPLAIFTYGLSPYEDYRAQAWAASLLLILVVLILNIALRILIERRMIR